MDKSDFELDLENWKHRPKEPKAYVAPPPPPKIDLTLHQKRVIVDYMLGGVSKGLFEDVEEFWEGVDDIEGTYPSYRDATDEFVEELKQKILKELT